MSRRPFALPALLLVLALPGAARAHEGHTHADEPAAPAAVADAHGTTAMVESDAHELLVRAGTIEPGVRTPLRLLLADRATNAPIADATIELTGGTADSTWIAHAESPGVYHADVVFADTGAVRLEALVRRGDELDLLTVEGLRVGHAHAEGGPAAAGGMPAWTPFALGAAGVVALAALFVAGRGRRRRGAGIAALLGALALAGGTSSIARAHEGELHGDEKAGDERRPAGDAGAVAAARTGAPPGSRFVAKEAQFELGLLTAVAHAEDLAETRHATGLVAADPAGGADVLAPQGGKFVARRAWQVGDRVARGQALGGILVVDELPVRAPIAGTIVQVGAVPGQTVAAGQVIARVVDLARVRVELPLFGSALSEALAARRATVRIAGGGPPLRARVLGLAPAGVAVGAPGGGAPLVLAVEGGAATLRPGMVVDAWLELATRVRAVAVPAAALVETERGPAVFVKVAPEAFVLRLVTVAARSGDRVGIRAGITDGERVVVAGAGPLLSVAEAPR